MSSSISPTKTLQLTYWYKFRSVFTALNQDIINSSGNKLMDAKRFICKPFHILYQSLIQKQLNQAWIQHVKNFPSQSFCNNVRFRDCWIRCWVKRIITREHSRKQKEKWSGLALWLFFKSWISGYRLWPTTSIWNSDHIILTWVCSNIHLRRKKSMIKLLSKLYGSETFSFLKISLLSAINSAILFHFSKRSFFFHSPSQNSGDFFPHRRLLCRSEQRRRFCALRPRQSSSFLLLIKRYSSCRFGSLASLQETDRVRRNLHEFELFPDDTRDHVFIMIDNVLDKYLDIGCSYYVSNFEDAPTYFSHPVGYCYIFWVSRFLMRMNNPDGAPIAKSHINVGAIDLTMPEVEHDP